MSDDSKIQFLVMATFATPHAVGHKLSRPFFVRADSVADAYATIMRRASERGDTSFENPHVHLEAFVLDEDIVTIHTPELE